MATKEKIILVWLKTKNVNLEEWEQKDWREETQSPEKKKKQQLKTEKRICPSFLSNLLAHSENHSRKRRKEKQERGRAVRKLLG